MTKGQFATGTATTERISQHSESHYEYDDCSSVESSFHGSEYEYDLKSIGDVGGALAATTGVATRSSSILSSTSALSDASMHSLQERFNLSAIIEFDELNNASTISGGTMPSIVLDHDEESSSSSSSDEASSFCGADDEDEYFEGNHSEESKARRHHLVKNPGRATVQQKNDTCNSEKALTSSLALPEKRSNRTGRSARTPRQQERQDIVESLVLRNDSMHRISPKGKRLVVSRGKRRPKPTFVNLDPEREQTPQRSTG